MKKTINSVVLISIFSTACGGSKGLPPPTSGPDLSEDVEVSLSTNEFGTTSIEGDLGSRSVIIDILEQDTIRITYEASEGAASDNVSPMVAKTTFNGVSGLSLTEQDGFTGVSLDDLSILVNDDLCVSIRDNDAASELALVCGPTANTTNFRYTINAPNTTQAYGLGEQFFNNGTDGDWLGRTKSPGIETGNRMVGFEAGAVGNLQAPVLLTYQGDAALGYFMDAPEAQTWNMESNPWSIQGNASSPAMYVFVGESHEDVRMDYLDLTGRPPVPPASAFGLWVSEYGYDNWAEAEEKITAQHNVDMPIDGIVLDLQWFGGINNREMGSLTWDTTNFPNPATRLAAWKNDWGIEPVVIEESYIDVQTTSYGQLRERGYLVRESSAGDPTFFNSWWGSGGMVDWSNEAAGDYWHDSRRTPLIDDGILGHWTDLGEPEDFDGNAFYADTFENKRNSHAAIHNLYNFYWSQSIYNGYSDDQPDKRPWILSRSGTSGSQRFGVSLWSGDIGTNARSLNAHIQTQMHMSMAGFDYYGSDIGGFHRGSISQADLNALYTVWLANGALFDVPVRAHTENLCNCKETAPALVGFLTSNQFNLRLRYKLFPYYYSLAHRAYQSGAAMFPPLAYYHPQDANAIDNGSMKYIGPSLLVRTYGDPLTSSTIDGYVPAGEWLDFHTGDWLTSQGETRALNRTINGITTLPMLAKAGAIIPQMYVDSETMNVHGRRHDNSVHDELIVMVVASNTASEFTLFEDDGESTAYIAGELTQTRITQQMGAESYDVTIEASTGTHAGALSNRPYEVKLYVPTDDIQGVSLNGQSLSIAATVDEFNTLAEAAVQVSPGHWRVKTNVMSTTIEKAFAFIRQ